MMSNRSARWATIATLASLGVALYVHDARAQGIGKGDASVHFRRGVELYGEANYTAALVELRRAYSDTPSAAALYDVGTGAMVRGPQGAFKPVAGAVKATTGARSLKTFPVEVRDGAIWLVA